MAIVAGLARRDLRFDRFAGAAITVTLAEAAFSVTVTGTTVFARPSGVELSATGLTLDPGIAWTQRLSSARP